MSVRLPAFYTDENHRNVPVELVVSYEKRGKKMFVRLQVIDNGDWRHTVEVHEAGFGKALMDLALTRMRELEE